eukprot:TRINITY_DN72156_c0_g1_i1.p1 TRINITY_DN72156_c0_g1~~TRINITY_DN72156_c0_g1_i1.p1  ORF type:complete len:839 (+),score=187.58 TRINITY_DN72156_c0_g1_i1:175-2691(+)
MAQAPPRPPGTYFEKKGEVHELRQLLRGAAADRDQQKKRDAIKKVIAYMTLGIDVSPLFSEMIMASATNDLVQKKMVYLYLVNYAESNADLAILAVNTLQKDCRDDDPMIRGLALRSLCSLNLANMVEYLQPAIQRALEDVDGYVRKTAVVGLVKLYHISQSAVLDTDLIDIVRRLINDNDCHVVSNVLYALEEVLVEEGGLQPTKPMVTSLLNKIAHFSEWGQCGVLRLLTKYAVENEEEMFDIMNILDSLLKQSSSAVVMSVTKIFVDLTSNRPELQFDAVQRLKGPLLTLMASSSPELAYTVLVHIQALCGNGNRVVDVFAPDFKQFFCRYNDPSYIKQVKIDILTVLADASSAEQVVTELSEYVTDVDAEISRRAIRAIGKIAVHIPSTAEMIVSSLTNLLELDIDYVCTEAAVVMKDLVRKYPQQFQQASGAVERCLRIVTEPDGKCAVLWILGEYGSLIEDAPYLLEPMIQNFMEEQNGAVRLETLTATVKLFFSRAPEVQKMLGLLFEKAISECVHPDVRDRALLYYRLLQHSPEECRRVICAPKEAVEEFQEEMDADTRDRIFAEFNSLSTVYKQPASKFIQAATSPFVVVKMQPPPLGAEEVAARAAQVNGVVSHAEQSMLPGFDAAPAAPVPSYSPVADSTDLLGGDTFSSEPARPVAQAQAASNSMGDLLGMDDLLGGESSMAPAAPVQVPQQQQPFALAPDTAMDQQTFQARWGQLPQLPLVTWPMRPMGTTPPTTTRAVEEALRHRCIYVMASGVIPPGQAMKFFFYARQAQDMGVAAQVWFLMELIMTPGSSCQLTLKADNASPSTAERFLALIREALSGYLAC